MFRKVPKAFAHDSGPEGSRKPRTYASSREFWKLLENVGTWAGAAGADQKLLECAGELGCKTLEFVKSYMASKMEMLMMVVID